jgi:membrane protease YdiL (CAAX protease family)
MATSTKLDTLRFLPVRLGITHIGLGWRFLLCVGVAISYMIASRVIYSTEGLSFTEIEIFRTPFRLISAVLFWFLMADVMFARRPCVRSLGNTAAIAGLSLLAVSPLLTIDSQASPADAAILAAASVPVALHEEFLFRGVLQTLLVKYIGVFQGICLTAILFTLYHMGATTPDTLNFILIFLAGLILGLIYLKTGSLLTVVLVHAIDDALIELPLNAVLPPGMAAVLLVASAALFLRWAANND